MIKWLKGLLPKKVKFDNEQVNNAKKIIDYCCKKNINLYDAYQTWRSNGFGRIRLSDLECKYLSTEYPFYFSQIRRIFPNIKKEDNDG